MEGQGVPPNHQTIALGLAAAAERGDAYVAERLLAYARARGIELDKRWVGVGGDDGVVGPERRLLVAWFVLFAWVVWDWGLTLVVSCACVLLYPLFCYTCMHVLWVIIITGHRPRRPRRWRRGAKARRGRKRCTIRRAMGRMVMAAERGARRR